MTLLATKDLDSSVYVAIMYRRNVLQDVMCDFPYGFSGIK